MAVAKTKKAKFIVRKSKKTGQRIKLYGGPMMKVLAAEKARKKNRNSTKKRSSAITKRSRNSAAKIKFIVKNGKRLYGAAANAVRNSRLGRKRNKLSGKTKLKRLASVAGGDRVKEALDILANPQKKRARKRNSALVIVNPRKRKRNGLYETFHGEGVRSITTDLAPDGTPNNVDILGKIDCIFFQKGDEHISANGKTKNGLEFGKDGQPRPKLASNQSGNRYYIVGKIPRFSPNGVFGEVTRIEYSARKPHIEGHDKEVPYWHKLGEENGVRPILETDHEGYLVLKRGNYRTTADGIEN